jgi:hypothetical protein
MGYAVKLRAASPELRDTKFAAELSVSQFATQNSQLKQELLPVNYTGAG